MFEFVIEVKSTKWLKMCFFLLLLLFSLTPIAAEMHSVLTNNKVCQNVEKFSVLSGLLKLSIKESKPGVLQKHGWLSNSLRNKQIKMLFSLTCTPPVSVGKKVHALLIRLSPP